jgi:hypothetical protein
LRADGIASSLPVIEFHAVEAENRDADPLGGFDKERKQSYAADRDATRRAGNLDGDALTRFTGELAL